MKKRPRRVDYPILFGAGVLFEALLSLDTVATSRFSAPLTALTSLTITLLSYAMYDKVVEDLAVKWDKALALGLGSATGAYLMTEVASRFYP